jgi:hypothetical protein
VCKEWALIQSLQLETLKVCQSMSALRHERKRVCPMSALHPKAHIVERDRDVSFVPQADILRRGKQ